MNEIFKDIIKQVETLSKLNEIVLEFGVLNNNEYITVGVIHGDGTGTDYKISVDEIAYLAEYGTVSFPGTHILQQLFYEVEKRFKAKLDEITDNVFNGRWDLNEVDRVLNNFEIFINDYISGRLAGYIKEMTYLADKTKQPDLIDFPVDISLLKKYISCKIYRKN